jgi:uncharacterized protein YbjQ (UPF0145 family)
MENEMVHCPSCSVSIGADKAICPYCFAEISDGFSGIPVAQILVFSTENPVSIQVESEVGLVFGNSSVQAFFGLSNQANRLSRAYEAALAHMKYNASQLGADAVIGVNFALNNSTGSAAVLAGSSEAVMLLGTAVKTVKELGK